MTKTAPAVVLGLAVTLSACTPCEEHLAYGAAIGMITGAICAAATCPSYYAPPPPPPPRPAPPPRPHRPYCRPAPPPPPPPAPAPPPPHYY